MVYKMIVSDIDGTLVDNKQDLSEITLDAVRRYIESGGMFTIATGRMEAAVHRFQDQLGLNVPAILYNGARVVDLKNDRVIHEWKLTERQVEAAVSMIEDYPMDMILYQDGRAYIKEMTELLAEHAGKDRVELIEIGDFKALDFKRITKALMIGDNGCFSGFMDVYNSRVQSKPEFVQSEETYLEILPSGADKGEALKALSGHTGIPLNEIIGIGDNPNDLGLVKTAGLGVAVSNAHKDVKQAAGMVVASNVDNGVAELIEKVMSGEILQP